MHDTAERVALVRLRVEELQQQRENRLLAGYTSLSALLVFSLMGAIGAMTDGAIGNVPGLCGSMLLFAGVGGYVLIGVVSFMAAVVITLLCIRGRKKHEANKQIFKGEGKNEYEG